MSRSPTPDLPTDRTTADLAHDMRRRWRAGEQTRAEDLLARHPELHGSPEAALDIVYEEFCLREAAGEAAADLAQDLLRRFPQWAGPLRVMLDCHRHLLDAVGSEREPRFPDVGERVGDFRLDAALGRGARGRVFLAAEVALAGRPVVLKLVPLDGLGAEHLSLARLQHTNIVPLYSVSDDASRRLRVICMPYFGRATLASVLAVIADVPVAQRTGRHITDALDRGCDAPAAAGPARQMLSRVSYVQAACWIAACLADALHFAHERGLVHLDLKPSNVLLGSEGQPMLLDFHLARAALCVDGYGPEDFGGTPPYMPPEQRAALRALREGRPVEADVDRRADVYALGAMLYESLGGRPADEGTPFPSLSRKNAHVGTGLSDVVDKCLAANPDERYPDALSLADDLRRHLTDQPLAGVANRSVAERWRKWRRRRPGALRVAALLAAGAGAAAVAGGHLHDRHEQAQMALLDGQRQLYSGRNPDEAVRTLRRGLDRLDVLPFGVDGDLANQLRTQLAAAQQAALARQLHDAADAVRMLPGARDVPVVQLRALDHRCRALWDRREEIVAAIGPASAEVSADFQDVALFAADLRIRLAAAADGGAARDEATKLLSDARRMFGDGVAIREYERALGVGDDAGRPPTHAPRSGREHCMLGRAYLAAGNLDRASRELALALRLDPADRWANFYAGVCAYRGGRHADAVAAFGTCIGAAPESAGCYHNRALAFAALDRPDDALRDYDRALSLDPAHAGAPLNRAALHLAARRFDAARSDLSLALANGAEPAAVHYNLALVSLAAGDRAAAAREAAKTLELDSSHAKARELTVELARR